MREFTPTAGKGKRPIDEAIAITKRINANRPVAIITRSGEYPFSDGSSVDKVVKFETEESDLPTASHVITLFATGTERRYEVESISLDADGRLINEKLRPPASAGEQRIDSFGNTYTDEELVDKTAIESSDSYALLMDSRDGLHYMTDDAVQSSLARVKKGLEDDTDIADTKGEKGLPTQETVDGFKMFVESKVAKRKIEQTTIFEDGEEHSIFITIDAEEPTEVAYKYKAYQDGHDGLIFSDENTWKFKSEGPDEVYTTTYTQLQDPSRFLPGQDFSFLESFGYSPKDPRSDQIYLDNQLIRRERQRLEAAGEGIASAEQIRAGLNTMRTLADKLAEESE